MIPIAMNTRLHYVRCLETGQTYISLTAAARAFGVPANVVKLWCTGAKEAPNGYHWECVHVPRFMREPKPKIDCKIKDVETGEVYDSVADAARKLGVHRSTIQKLLRRGIHFKYLD